MLCYGQVVTTVRCIVENTTMNDLSRSVYAFTDLNITDENVLKLTPDRLIDMDIHCRSDMLAIVGCDRKGTVGLVVKVDASNSTNKKKRSNDKQHDRFSLVCRRCTRPMV
jgi:hypothetical protein